MTMLAWSNRGLALPPGILELAMSPTFAYDTMAHLFMLVGECVCEKLIEKMNEYESDLRCNFLT